jgi:transposase
VALGYKGAWIIESCFRRLKQTGLELRPIFHWSPRRIEAHVKLCVLALQMQRAAEIRCAQTWARIAHELAALKAIRYRAQGRAIVQRTKIPENLVEILKTLDISMSKKIISVAEPAPDPVPA